MSKRERTFSWKIRVYLKILKFHFSFYDLFFVVNNAEKLFCNLTNKYSRGLYFKNDSNTHPYVVPPYYKKLRKFIIL